MYAQRVVAADIGNSAVKMVSATSKAVFPAVVRKISQMEAARKLADTSQNANADWIIQLDGQYWEFGELAEIAVPLRDRQKGGARYHEEWHVPLLAAALCKVYEVGQELNLIITHAPQDDDLRGAIRALYDGRTLNCVHKGQTKNFKVSYVTLEREPVAGIRYSIYNEEGKPLKDRVAQLPHYLMVLDAGGRTLDTAFAQAGKLFGTQQSTDTYGVNEATVDLAEEIRRVGRAKFGHHHPISRKVDEALRTGVYRGGISVGDIKVKEAAEEYRQRVVAAALNILDESNMDMTERLFVVGGGADILKPALQKRFGKNNVELPGEMVINNQTVNISNEIVAHGALRVLRGKLLAADYRNSGIGSY